MSLRCPLCAAAAGTLFHAAADRRYLRCATCALVFVPPAQRLSREEERAVYELHDNRIDDPGYRRFLARLADPLLQRLTPQSRGLDFGCGPVPLLAAMLEEHGHRVALHDSFFHPRPQLLEGRYDFITASEVVEHLHAPGRTLDSLWACLRPGGWLAIMTKLVIDADAFARWHYIRDPTHVCFFSRATWRWWAARAATEAHFRGGDVILLRKPAP